MLSALCASLMLVQVDLDTVTLGSLLTEMVDRSSIARLANPSYKCLQASSYDRRTISPNDQNDWYANMDRSWFVRKEVRAGRTEHVMMDVDGPGAIVRVWTTWDGNSIVPNSTLRVYFDGSNEPAIEGPVIDLISGGALAGAPLSMSVSEETDITRRGHNLYLPIPFSQRCVVTIEIDAEVDDGAYKSPAFYYQINYRLYESGTDVESFSHAALEESKSSGQLDEVQEKLSEATYEELTGSRTHTNANLGPGENIALEFSGNKVITTIKLGLYSDDIEQALRSTVVELTFDGNRTVWIPAGALFGLGHKAELLDTWWSDYDGGIMTCRWPMPFNKSATVKLINLDDKDVQVDLTVYTEPWDWDERSLYFHAVWNPHFSIETQAGTSEDWLRATDVNFATIQGQGKWVGDVLMIFNGASSWWGEGDEKIWVDGENFPSHIGTGTEDYYGYAWGMPTTYSAPFIAQPIGFGNNRPGGAVNLRWRSLDAIPFDNSLQFDMELWHWAKTKMNFEPASFFYARPGAVVNIKPKPEMASMPVPKTKGDVVPIFYVKGAIEAELMQLSATGGEIDQQTDPGLGWSGDLQVWWKFGEVGNELTLVFDSEVEGWHEILAGLTIANDYAIAAFSLNGKELHQELDLYSPQLDAKEFNLGIGQLKQTGNVLKIKLVGSNKDAIRKMMVGIDYIRPGKTTRIKPTQIALSRRP